jgi:hypothetical protein
MVCVVQAVRVWRECTSMQRFCFSGLLFIVCVVMASEAWAQPGRDTSKDGAEETAIPEGFELQKLELGGEILRPKGWKFETREIGKTIATKMWEPLPDDPDSYNYDTGFSIDIVTNTAEAGLTPSAYAEQYMESLKQQGTVVREYDPVEANGMVQSSVLLDQKLNRNGSEKDYRIRTILFAHDENELLFVLTFGTVANDWDKYEPTFRVMTQKLKLIDLKNMR